MSTQAAKRKRFTEYDSEEEHDEERGDAYVANKRKKPTIDKTLKIKVFSALLHLFHVVGEIMKFAADDYLNLNKACELAAVTYNLFNQMRQEKNSSIDKVQPIIDRTTNVTLADRAILVKVITWIFSQYGLLWTTKPEWSVWVGTASPIAALMFGFKYRFEEVRLGTTKLTTGKIDGVTQRRNMSGLGIPDRFQALSTGVLLPPNMRGSLSGSVGTGVKIALIRVTKEQKYLNKWTAALASDLRNLPYGASIATSLARNPVGTVKAAGSVFLECAALGMNRVQNRMLPPPIFLRLLYDVSTHHPWGISNQKFTGSYAPYDLDRVVKDGEPSGSSAASRRFTFLAGLEKLDFSGLGMAVFAKMISITEVQFTHDYSMSDEKIQQLVFHAQYGTHVENLAIIEKALGGTKLLQRCDYTKEDYTHVAEPKKLKVLNLLYLSKLATGTTDKTIQGKTTQLCSASVFAGKTKQQLSKDFVNSLGHKGLDSRANSDAQLSTWLPALNKEIAKRKQNLMTIPIMERGTTDWYPLAGVSNEGWGTPHVMSDPGRPKFFYGDDKQE